MFFFKFELVINLVFFICFLLFKVQKINMYRCCWIYNDIVMESGMGMEKPLEVIMFYHDEQRVIQHALSTLHYSPKGSTQ